MYGQHGDVLCHYQILAHRGSLLKNEVLMKRIGLLLIGTLLIAPSVHAQTVSDDIIAQCKAMYPIREYTTNTNTSIEKTGADPKQFLIRRCITEQRKKILNERRAERAQIRAAARYDRSAAQTQQLRIENENYIQDAIRRQNLKESRFRSRTNLLDPDIFYEGRRSRRAIIRDTEGLDRINAIRRNLRSQNLPDPCTSVGAIRQYNNPCSDYGSRAGRVH